VGRLHLLAICLLLALLPACTKQRPKPVRHGEPQSVVPVATTAPGAGAGASGKLAGGNADFACELYGKLCADPGNVVLSPHGISEALAMAYAGAAGNTEREMAKALHLPVDQAKVPSAFADLRGALGVGTYLLSANAVWTTGEVSLLPAYSATLAESYGAEPKTLDMSNRQRAADAVNAWASKNTKGMIPQVIVASDFPALTGLVLTNAVYHKGEWQVRFDPKATASQAFHSPTGPVNVQMMFQKTKMQYAEGAGWQAVLLPYKDGDMSMLVMLPAEGQLEEFEALLGPPKLSEVLGKLGMREVLLKLPRFTIEGWYDLNGALVATGMPSAFDPGSADFSGIGGSAGDLWIHKVRHRARVEADEKGTEAAAATAVLVEMKAKAAPAQRPVEFTCDRPFLFIIRHNTSGAVLFLGRVSNPVGTR